MHFDPGNRDLEVLASLPPEGGAPARHHDLAHDLRCGPAVISGCIKRLREEWNIPVVTVQGRGQGRESYVPGWAWPAAQAMARQYLDYGGEAVSPAVLTAGEAGQEGA